VWAGRSTQIEVPEGVLKQHSDAEAVARQRVEEQDAPANPAHGDFIEYLRAFWNFETSADVRGEINRGKTISRRHCGVMLDMVRKYVEPTFKGQQIEALGAPPFDTCMARLCTNGTPARTINLARQTCNVPLNELVRLRRGSRGIPARQGIVNNSPDFQLTTHIQSVDL
jgi:hypothetical protein